MVFRVPNYQCPIPKNNSAEGTRMARKAMIEKSKRKPKFAVRQHNRCQRCGRSRAFLRKFGLCRICFRDMSLNGLIPGVRKSSW